MVTIKAKTSCQKSTGYFCVVRDCSVYVGGYIIIRFGTFVKSFL